VPEPMSLALAVDWSGEQFVAVVSLAAALIPVLALLLPTGRKRVVYRVPLDAPVSVAHEQVGGDTFGLGIKILHNGIELSNPSLVLIRVKNAGRRTVSWRDWEVPLYCSFGGRVVVAAEVTTARQESLVNRVMPRPVVSEPTGVDDRSDRALRDAVSHWPGAAVVGRAGAGPVPAAAPGNALSGPGAPATYVVTSPFGLNRREWFRLLVLVAGPGDGVRVRGRIEDGSVVKEPTNRRPGVRAAVLTGSTLALVGLAAGLLFAPSIHATRAAHDPPSYCGEGQLVGQGSSAFEDIMKTLGRQYEHDCPGATVQYTATSSDQGTDSLARIDPADAPNRLAMSDGLVAATPTSLRRLEAHRVAVLTFAVVVNDQVGVRVKSLKREQLERIFTGEYTNWDQVVPGFDKPIHVIGRSSTSGTRRAFERQILKGRSELPPNSDDCDHRRDNGPAAGIKCERGDTKTLLDEVQQTAGAIGYAELAAASNKRYVATVQIDGFSANVAAVRGGLYNFWTIEYAYTYGDPSLDSLVAKFLKYLSTPYAAKMLESDQHLSCTAPDVPLLCSSSR
jgi:phosphate transport system substrate-binding protein